MASQKNSNQQPDPSRERKRRGTGGKGGGRHAAASGDRRVGDRRRMKPGADGAHPGKRKRPRTDGPCPIMDACGGCAWLGLPYRKQLALKQEASQDLFAELIERNRWDVTVDPIVGMGGIGGDTGAIPAPRAFRYKASTPFAPGACGAVRCGFFSRGTHAIVPVGSCIVEADGSRAILNGVAAAAERLGIPAYDEDRRRGLLRYAVLRMGWKRDEAMLTVVTSRREIPRRAEFVAALRALDPRIVCIAQNVNPRPGNAILGNETRILDGTDHMVDELLGCTFAISPGAFYQTNPQQTETLYRLAIDGIELRDGDVLMDAYCGSGTIGIAAAAQARSDGADVELIGVERNQAGIRDAKRNARLNDLSEHCRFVAQDATAFMVEAARRGERIDVLSIDPPRAGSTPEFLEAACALGPRRIVYVSCGPSTQVRDIEHLARRGWKLTRLTPVDMFPHTPHIETVAVLER